MLIVTGIPLNSESVNLRTKYKIIFENYSYDVRRLESLLCTFYTNSVMNIVLHFNKLIIIKPSLFLVEECII